MLPYSQPRDLSVTSKYVALGEDGARCQINKGGDDDDDDDVSDDGDRLKHSFL